jgi:hypothetical protein
VPAEIGRFSITVFSFLIALSFFSIVFFGGVGYINAGEASLNNNNVCEELDFQASKAVIERRFLLLIATLKGRF